MTASTEISKVDIKTELITFGYVKIIQKLLPTTSIFYTIPPSVAYLIATYCRPAETFGHIYGSFRMSNNETSVEVNNYSDWTCAYGSIPIPSISDTHCVWRIKFDKLINAFFIGIVTKRKGKFPYSYYDFYALYGNQRRVQVRKLNEPSEYKPIGCRTDDVITMELNLKDAYIKWCLNDEQVGFMKNIKRDQSITYYLGVGCYTMCDKLSIIEFKYL